MTGHRFLLMAAFMLVAAIAVTAIAVADTPTPDATLAWTVVGAGDQEYDVNGAYVWYGNQQGHDYYKNVTPGDWGAPGCWGWLCYYTETDMWGISLSPFGKPLYVNGTINGQYVVAPGNQNPDKLLPAPEVSEGD